MALGDPKTASGRFISQRREQEPSTTPCAPVEARSHPGPSTVATVVNMGISTHSHLLLLLLGILAFTHRSQGLRCQRCKDVTCEFLDTTTCTAGTAKDVCGCCYVCAKDLDQQCGGPWNIHGKCGKGLKCLKDEEDFNSDGVCVEDYQPTKRPIDFPK